MRRSFAFLCVLGLVALTIAGCGGGSAGAPAKMATYDAAGFSIQYPEAWQKAGLDLEGYSVAIFSQEPMSMTDFEGLDNPPDWPLGVLMYTPKSDSEFTLDNLDESLKEQETDATILSQSDVTLDGNKGKVVKAKGQMGDHTVVIEALVTEKGDNTLVFFGISPEGDWSKTEAIYDWMVKSVKIK